MTTLFLLTEEYRAAAEKLESLDLDEQTVADTLESIAGDFEDKAQSVAFMIRNWEATVASINEFTATQQARAKALELKAERLRDYLHGCMDAAKRDKIERPGIVLSFRKSSAVIINDSKLIPPEYMRQAEPPAPAPDKKAIGEALKAGKDVPGAVIENRRNLQIK